MDPKTCEEGKHRDAERADEVFDILIGSDVAPRKHHPNTRSRKLDV